MGLADKYIGLMQKIQLERFQNVYGTLSQPLTQGASISRVFTNAYTGVTLPAGAEILLALPYSLNYLTLRTSTPTITGASAIDVETVTVNENYPAGSSLIVDNNTVVKNKFKRYMTVHHNGYFRVNGSTGTTDYLASDGSYDFDSRTTYVDGQLEENRFGGIYGILNNIGTEFKIHEITTNLITTLPSPTALTLSFWKKNFNPSGTNTSAMDLVFQDSITSNSNPQQGYQLAATRLEVNANSQFDANDVLIPTIRQDRTQRNTFVTYFDTQIVLSTQYN